MEPISEQTDSSGLLEAAEDPSPSTANFHFREILLDESISDSGSNHAPDYATAYHEHQTLAHTFEKEQQWSREAAKRVRKRILDEKKKEQEEREEDRQSRWYNQVKSRTRRKTNGSKLAQRRVKRHQRKEQKIEEKRRKSARGRWYTNRERLLESRITMDLIQANANGILKESRRKLQAEALQRDLDEKSLRNKIEEVTALSKQVFRRCRPKQEDALEFKIIRQEQPPFYPGPYLNAIESSYGQEEIATPRRTFQATKQHSPT